MPKGKNTKSKVLYTLRLRTDHLVMFAHPNEKSGATSPFSRLPNHQHNPGRLDTAATALPLSTTTTTPSTPATTPMPPTLDSAVKRHQQNIGHKRHLLSFVP
jgi:hypothetical protein